MEAVHKCVLASSKQVDTMGATRWRPQVGALKRTRRRARRKRPAIATETRSMSSGGSGIKRRSRTNQRASQAGLLRSNLQVAVAVFCTLALFGAGPIRLAPAATASNQAPIVQQKQQAAAANGSLEALEDLIAVGRVSLAAPPSTPQDLEDAAAASNINWNLRHQDGRLVDRIAEPAGRQANKLDYIIDFLRSNKLSKFCDLLAGSREPVASLIEQLNQMKQFTLFVPTNEALLLMPSGQLEAVQSEADETRRFLMAHVTRELVVPKLAVALRHKSQLASKYSAWGAQNRWSSGRASERIVDERPSEGADESQERALYSLSGASMRIITTPQSSPPATSEWASAGATQLELIVNGANVISGHSYALQEPNNTQVTYAIVHLIDRPLYPEASETLYERIGTLSPHFAKLLQLAQDRQLLEQLRLPSSGGGRLVTAFLPADDSLRLPAQTRLLEQLETNRTRLQHFLRSHFVEGLFFSGQLASQANGSLAPAATPTRQLTAMSGAELEIDSKTLQSRRVILVNSVPLLEHDQMALNGVLHLTTRPISDQDRAQASACNCEPATSAAANSTSVSSTSGRQLEEADVLLLLKKFSSDDQVRRQNRLPPNATPSAIGHLHQKDDQSLQAEPARRNTTSRLASGAEPNSAGGRRANELEREESQALMFQANLAPHSQAQNNNNSNNNNKIVRSQRSDDLIARNNRNFYRPSTAPENLFLLADGEQPGLAQTNPQNSTGQGIVLSGLHIDSPARDSWTNGQSRPVRLQEQQNSDALLTPSAFEVDRYKVVLNATSRQKLREQQGLILSSSLNNKVTTSTNTSNSSSQNNGDNKRDQAGSNRNEFVYDQPLSTQRTPALDWHNSRLNYAPPSTSLEPAGGARGEPAPEVNGTRGQTSAASNQDQLGWASSTQRQQRLLLKFQAQDARDQPYGPPLTTNFSLNQEDQLQRLGTQHESRLEKSGQRFGKTIAPPTSGAGSSFSGCAFYDADCKRLVGRLVRLPPNRASQAGPLKVPANQSQTQDQKQLAGGRPTPVPIGSLKQHQPPASASFSTPASAFDSTFGETTENPLLRVTSGGVVVRFSTPVTAAARQQHNGTGPHRFREPSGQTGALFGGGAGSGSSSARLSPLNQPLPPWSDDEEEQRRKSGRLMFLQPNERPAGGVKHNWRHQEADISRIRLAASSASSGPVLSQAAHLNRVRPLQTIGTNNDQHVLMIPMQMLENSNIAFPSSQIRPSANQTGPLPIYFAAQPQQQQPQQQQAASNSQRLQEATFNSNANYFSPTPQPAYLAPQSQAAANGHPFGRLVNLTALELAPSEAIDPNRASTSQRQQHHGSASKQTSSSQPSGAQNSLNSPAKLAASAAGQQAMGQHQVEAMLRDSIKEARKVVRLQVVSGTKHEEPSFGQSLGGSDISVTSARLTSQSARPASAASNFTLVSQASDQSAVRPAGSQTAALIVPAGAPSQSGAAHSEGASTSAEFFQNRTIAEIMDDSGLRIDGQQVTFGRLRECLEKANLSDLVSQQGSALTIFMPTDAAFQRLVQQQALMQQQLQRTSRFAEPARRHLIPLIAKVGSRRHQLEPEAFNRLSSGPTRESLGPAPSDTSAPSLAATSAASLANRLTLDCSTQQARQLLLDHLSGQLVTPRELQTDLVLSSLSGKRLLLSSVPSKKIVVVDGQPVVAATRAKNGMVYVLNKFLNMSHQMPNVVELLESQPNLKTFQSYLSFASLSDRLKRETGPLTILAPTNEAFEQLSVAARQLINSDPSAMMDILRGHIIEGAQFGKLVSMRNRLKTMNSDHYIEAKVIKPNIYQLDNQMTSLKLIGTAGNGVVNAIDRLIVPPWLRVVTGTSRQAAPNETSGTFGRAPETLDNVGRLETSRHGATSAPLNLPSLNSQPIRFEQPDARLAPTNSFSLADSTTASSFSPANSNDLGLRANHQLAGPSHFESSTGSLSSSDTFNGSRLWTSGNNLTEQPEAAPGNRLSVGSDETSSNRGTSSFDSSASRSTKNMQLIEKLAGLMRTRKFLKYLMRSKLSSMLKADMNYVLLVPTDQAMERLPKQILDMLERDPERLSDLVSFHVLDTTFEYINTIPDGQTLSTLNEKDILFNWHRNNTILTASGAVVLGGIQEENIALLVVDRVLYPTPGDLLSIVTKSPILSNFTSLIRSAGLESQLSLAGPFTLFAPSDFAFNQLDRRDFELLRRSRETARRFLLRHLSQPAIFTSSVALSNTTEPTPSTTATTSAVPAITITNSLGEDLTLRQKNDYFSVNEVNFSYADVAATNGVVHVIDGLL